MKKKAKLRMPSPNKWLMAALALLLAVPMAMAQPMVGAPVEWGMGLQPAGGAVKEWIHWMNDIVFDVIVAITVFVGGLLAYVMWRYSAKRNPVPSTTSHHTGLEIAWTVIPVLILIGISIPSFRLVYYQDRTQEADLTIQVTGRQWFWQYAFPDHGAFQFDSRPVPTDELRPGQLRNLSVDEPLVLPVGANVRVLNSGVDVIHSFFVPALGVQRYNIPGRTIETWFRTDREGVFYGQCNQICGVNHWFMPIEVRVVPRAEFDQWVAAARTRFAGSMPQGTPAVAQSPSAPIITADAAR